jgi:hypothetical protein
LSAPKVRAILTSQLARANIDLSGQERARTFDKPLFEHRTASPMTPGHVKLPPKQEVAQASAVLQVPVADDGHMQELKGAIAAAEILAKSRVPNGIWAHQAASSHPDFVANCDFNRGIYDKSEWDASLTKTKKMVLMCRRGMGKATKEYTYTVPLARANKALKLLHPAHLEASLKTPCGCTHACNSKFSAADLIRKRLWYLSFASELESRSGSFFPSQSPLSHQHVPCLQACAWI